MNLSQIAYHEAGHALVLRDQRRRVDEVVVSVDGGMVRQEPLAPDASPEQIEAALVAVLAGEIAAGYAPRSPHPDVVAVADQNGGYGVVDGMVAMAGADKERPSDQEVVDFYTEKIGAEAVQRARTLAVELVDRKHVTGVLGRLADELYWRGAITGDEMETILAAP